MIPEFSADVKKFLLTYTSIDQLIRLARGELNRINGLLEGEIAEQPWFSSTKFQTARSWQWLQVWKKHWQPSVTQKCPWIHFEYALSWPNQWVQASVDLESQRIASWDAIQSVADHLRRSLSENGPKFLKGQGWLFPRTLEENRMVLINRRQINDATFSAEWILDTGKEMFNQLSEVVPYVDRAVDELFAQEKTQAI